MQVCSSFASLSMWVNKNKNALGMILARWTCLGDFFLWNTKPRWFSTLFSSALISSKAFRGFCCPRTWHWLEPCGSDLTFASLFAHTRETDNPIKRWAKDLNRRFSKEDVWMASKHRKRRSTPLREMHISTTMRNHLTADSVAIIKKNPQTTRAGKDVEKRELSSTAGGNVNWHSHYGRQFGDSERIQRSHS